MSSILITGIHGFVGSNLVATLKEKHTIYGLDIVSPQKEGIISTYAWEELGILPSVDMIIHLAGKAHDTNDQLNEQDYFDINTGLTLQIFDFFLKSSAKRFIFFSSVKAVADSVIGEQLTEEVSPNPKTPYGKSKLEAEKYILNEFEKWKKKEIACGRINELKKVYILRPCMIHGPGNKGNLNLLYKLQNKGIPWPLGAFDNNRSFTSIQNLQFVIQELIENDIKPDTYQIADDESLSTNQLIRLMADSLNRKAHIWNFSPRMIKLMAITSDKLGLPLNSERLKKLTESYVVSNQKLKNALNIEKMPFTAEEGLKKTFDSFL
jgi:nucleoside-diphosphate-sugar epimerase